MRQPVRVVLADDHDAFVEGLGMVLSAEDDLEVVALAGDGASALQAVLTHRPDVLVVDTQMPGPAVTELVRLVGQAEPATRVLLLAEDARLEPSTQPDPGGPAGMTRAVSARELAEAIRAVAAGFRVVMAPRPDGPGHGAPAARGYRAPTGRVTARGKRRERLSTAPTGPGPTSSSATSTPSCCCAACRSGSARSWPCWPAATPTAASPRPATCRSTPSAPTCRTCWSSWAYTPSWRRPRWPCARGWCGSRTTPSRRSPTRAWRSWTSVGAGPLDRRNFLKAGAGAVVAGLVAWRFWPWRRGGGPPATPAGPPPEPVAPPAGLTAVDRLPTDRTRTWLGPPTGPTGSRTGGSPRVGWSA